MTNKARPISSAHLVDAQVAGALALFPPLELDHETLPILRARMYQRPSLDGAELFPDVERDEHLVPGSAENPAVRVLVYRPARAATGTLPALVWMHGGGYVFGQADDTDILCRTIARSVGVVVASVDYRLAPETPAPGPLDDCYAVLAWLEEHAPELGVDRARAGVGGSSAGGGLAACLAIMARDRAEYPICFQLLIYPMLDDRTSSTAEPNPFAGEFVWTPKDNRFGWASMIGSAPGGPGVSEYVAAARVESTAGLPAAYIGVGALDLFAEEDIRYAMRLMSAGVPAELHVYPGAYHGFEMAPEAWMTKAHLASLLAAIARNLGG